MISFEVNDMSCNHCVGVITRAVQGVNAQADVAIDLATHRVQIDADAGEAEKYGDAIREAGYTPVPMA